MGRGLLGDNGEMGVSEVLPWEGLHRKKGHRRGSTGRKRRKLEGEAATRKLGERTEVSIGEMGG